MVDVETKTKRETPPDAPAAVWTPEPAPREPPRRRLRVLPFVLTAMCDPGPLRNWLIAIAVAIAAAIAIIVGAAIANGSYWYTYLAPIGMLAAAAATAAAGFLCGQALSLASKPQLA